MELTGRIETIIFFTVLLFSLVPTSRQYSYSCSSNASCGCSSSPASITRIVGGESAATNTWSWAVSLSIGGSSLCGGSVLSSSWIITAAHCMAGVLPSQVRVYAGSVVRFAGQSRTAASITIHPGYDSASKINDIALIRLSRPLVMNDSSVQPICVPSVDASTFSSGEWPPAGLFVVAVGWGTLSESGSLPLYLQQVTVQTIDYHVWSCSSILNSSRTQFCAGVYGGGKDTCQGDSGGPLMMFTTSNQWVLVGLTSYGYGCARADTMGVYTRVAVYQDWIRQTTGSAYTNPASSISAKVNPFSSTTDPSPTDDATPVSPLPFLLSALLFIAFCLF